MRDFTFNAIVCCQTARGPFRLPCHGRAMQISFTVPAAPQKRQQQKQDEDEEEEEEEVQVNVLRCKAYVENLQSFRVI